MGICESSESKAQAAESAKIDRELAKAREQAEKTVKLLLLGLHMRCGARSHQAAILSPINIVHMFNFSAGAGESGKSTLVKQMKIIHGDGYTNEELISFKPTICDNLVHSMRAVLEAMGACLYLRRGR